uniref:Fibronectin type-III domain-containing protein n=1 Tax=Panagrolaimus sp. PS1159 TaxID=55785 RepID=A0AC35GJE9_9BILA
MNRVKFISVGLPDPPSQVQVEVGPQPGTLLISWKPVTSQPKPPSRAAVHSYLVFADGRNIAQVPSATADHVLLRLADFADDPPIFITVRTRTPDHVLLRLADFADDPPIFITVRTRTREGAISADSNVVRVPRGISATNPNVLASREQLPFSSSIAVNTATGPLTTTSLPNSLIGNVVGSQPHHSEFLQSAMNTIAMPYGMQQTSGLSAGSAPSGLLTTLSQHQQQQSMGTQQQQLHQLHHTQAMHPQIYNTAYPMTQSAMLPSTQTAAAANAALYGTGVGQPSGTLLNGATNAAKLAD